MYKIFNNEIKITQNLKGGSSSYTLAGIDADLNYKKLFEPYLDEEIFFDAGTFLRDGKLMEESLKHLIPLQAYSIDYKKLDDKMVEAIQNDIEKLTDIFFDGEDNKNAGDGEYRIFNNTTNPIETDEVPAVSTSVAPVLPSSSGTSTAPSTTVTDPKKVRDEGGLSEEDLEKINERNLNKTVSGDATTEKNDIFNKNILRYAMSWAKEIELYDVKNNKLLSYEEFLKKMFQDPTKSPTNSGISAQTFFNLITKNSQDFDQSKDKLKGIIAGINVLLKAYPAVGEECAKMYPKIVVEHKLPHWFGMGGAYDNLKYSLEGGVLSTLIRVPNLSAHFKGQLNVIEARLKNSNKTLSVISKTKIQNVIDQLKKHEDYLKETFNLLRNSHLIDENKIDIVKHKSQLEKAKMSLRKHDRYRSFLTDIIKTIKDAENSLSDKPYFS
jgi:hypothetical protein